MVNERERGGLGALVMSCFLNLDADYTGMFTF